MPTDAADPDVLRCLTQMIHVGQATVASVKETHDVVSRCNTFDISVRVADRALMDATEVVDRIQDAQIVNEDEMDDEEEITAVDRPSTHTITVAGVCNLEVKWDKARGLFRLISVCPNCGRRFERTLRGFVTKELVTLAHDLGFKLGEHLERHQTFGEYLRDLQRKKR